MIQDYSWDAGPDVAGLGDDLQIAEVPSHLDTVPDTGQPVLVIGDVDHYRELNHKQGENPFGYQNTCGLVSCEDVLRQFGVNVSEGDVVRHAMTDRLCVTDDVSPEKCGGSTVEQQVHILNDGGVPAHVQSGASLGDLTNWVEQGHGVIIEVNAGELWGDPRYYEHGQYNHAIVVTGVAVDPMSGEVAGYYVNDSGRGEPGDSGRFVTADQMQQMWVGTGGAAVTTDAVH